MADTIEADVQDRKEDGFLPDAPANNKPHETNDDPDEGRKVVESVQKFLEQKDDPSVQRAAENKQRKEAKDTEGSKETDAGEEDNASDEPIPRASSQTTGSLDRDLVDIALTEAGLSPDKLRQFSSNEQLEAYLDAVADGHVNVPAKGSKAESEDEDWDIPEITGDDVEPWVLKQNAALKKAKEKVKAQEAELKELRQGVEQVARAMGEKAHADEVDKFETTVVSKTKSETLYARLFGKGPLDDLKEGSAHHENRVALWNKVGELRSSFQGKRAPSMRKLVDDAAVLLFRDEFNKAAREELNGTLKERSKQMTQPPTQRETPADAKGDKTLTNMRQTFRDKGWSD